MWTKNEEFKSVISYGKKISNVRDDEKFNIFLTNMRLFLKGFWRSWQQYSGNLSKFFIKFEFSVHVQIHTTIMNDNLEIITKTLKIIANSFKIPLSNQKYRMENLKWH